MPAPRIPVTGLRSLEVLEMSYAKCSNAGLRYLAGLPKLGLLNISGPMLRQSAVSEFMQASPLLRYQGILPDWRARP